MNTQNIRRGVPATGFPDGVSGDFSALAAHMRDCESSRSPYFRFYDMLQTAHDVASPRIVTTVAVFVLCGLTALAIA